jgi:hypothetical protein
LWPPSGITEQCDAEHSTGKQITIPSEYLQGIFLWQVKDGPPLGGGDGLFI